MFKHQPFRIIYSGGWSALHRQLQNVKHIFFQTQNSKANFCMLSLSRKGLERFSISMQLVYFPQILILQTFFFFLNQHSYVYERWCVWFDTQPFEIKAKISIDSSGLWKGVTRPNFQRFFKSSKPLVFYLQFWSATLGFCKALPNLWIRLVSNKGVSKANSKSDFLGEEMWATLKTDFPHNCIILILLL